MDNQTNLDQQQFPNPDAVYPAPQNNGKKKKIIMYSCIGVAVVVVAVVLILIFTSRSVDSLVDKFCDAVNDKDADAVVDLCSDDFIEAYAKTFGVSESAVKDEIKKEVKSQLFDQLGSVKIKVEIKSEETQKLDNLGVDGYSPSEEKLLTLSVKDKSSGKELKTIKLLIFKVGRKWCLDMGLILFNNYN